MSPILALYAGAENRIMKPFWKGDLIPLASTPWKTPGERLDWKLALLRCRSGEAHPGDSRAPAKPRLPG